MPYDSDVDLPFSVCDHLPPDARDIYRTAFNHAFMTYTGYPDREEIAQRVAWGAVKRFYVKHIDCWVLRNGLSTEGDTGLEQQSVNEDVATIFELQRAG